MSESNNAWLPMDDAPKDGTRVRLWTEFLFHATLDAKNRDPCIRGKEIHGQFRSSNTVRTWYNDNGHIIPTKIVYWQPIIPPEPRV